MLEHMLRISHAPRRVMHSTIRMLPLSPHLDHCQAHSNDLLWRGAIVSHPHVALEGVLRAAIVSVSFGALVT